MNRKPSKSVPGSAPKKKRRVLSESASDRKMREAGYRKVPDHIASGSFEDFVKWKNGGKR